MSRTVVRLRQAPKDRTAAERMRRYRNKKAQAVTPTPAVERRKAPSRAREANIVTVPPVTPAVTVERPPVDLTALRREIAEWVQRNRDVERQKRKELRAYISWQVSRFVFFVLGVAFFALIFAAVS